LGAKQRRIAEAFGKDPIGGEDALTLDGPRLVEFIKRRRIGGAGPSTAGNELTWIGVVLRAAKNVDRKPSLPRLSTKLARHAASAD